MNSEILAVGTEILMGQIANTNAQYISRRLQDIGINVYYHSVVGDNPERLQKTLNLALSRSNVIILTGGLGPTQDDLTKETVAKAVGKKLILDEQSLQEIRELFKSRAWEMSENNIRQAYFPEGSLVLRNPYGTAPGCIIEFEGKILVMLPGPPSEMKPMFEEYVLPFLEEKSKFRIVSRYIRVFGLGEAAVEDRLLDLIKAQTNPTIATYAGDGEVAIRLTWRYEKDSQEDLDLSVEREICKRLGNKIYACENKNLEEVVGNLLIEKNTSLALVETFTGGSISAALTKRAEVSKLFKQGCVLSKKIISKEEAVKTAQQIREKADTDLGLAVLAPVEAGTEKEGLDAYLALASAEKVESEAVKFFGNQERRRRRMLLQALNMIREFLI
ncbi:MAG: competence/damage-inducible protein A [Desulfitobacteriia bacterium]|jgi:nicotinamide-nucleotide amidase